MLKNELEILASDFIPYKGGHKAVQKKTARDFGKMVSDSCGKAREAWATAAFSQSSDYTLRRYFDFHFKFLCGLISENIVYPEIDTASELCLLMDHLLLFYGEFIDHEQVVSTRFFAYRHRLIKPMYERFIEKIKEAKINNELLRCIQISLSPLYLDIPSEGLFLRSLFYREELNNALAVIDGDSSEVIEESLVSSLMAFNFNNFHFYRFLRERANLKSNEINESDRGKYFLELSAAIPVVTTENHPSFDKRWPHICNAYKGWLTEQGALLNLACSIDESNKPIRKVPLNISVKYLGCMIRALHESGFYGTVSLSDIFDNAVASFTTKRQEHISRDSLSNAFYNISQPTAGRMIHIFNNSTTFLKFHYFPL